MQLRINIRNCTKVVTSIILPIKLVAMRSSILLLVLSAAVLGGCTSAYKTGQTPDDVYYSPARQQDEYVNVKENDDTRYQGNDEYYDDQYLRMESCSGMKPE